jgi:hypothetical protein
MAGLAQKNDGGEVNKIIKKFKEKDPGLSKFFSSAYGYAVFPGIEKGGLGVLVAPEERVQFIRERLL